ncbi:MAG TPA: outer membrane beta-barrel protein [Chitinophaga sp.]|uniref:outer membrane beta-barrel protein n=1 Tax=Chitinophaga sp. TaxID=1869181 RepID=UPI002DB70099|nr:outer membrane beta-barrel protein [Chitinophaga sp.]HEU4551298.1 outer membrane beta-barrel protein [Chitinophaga sp.]
MKKIILLASLCLAGVQASQAQHFSHGVGVGIFVEDAEMADAKGSFTFTYSPRFSFAETDKTSFSIGIPLNVGFSGSYNANYDSYYGYSEENTLGYMINVPLMLNFNIGAGSARGCQNRMGYFIGAGYAYHVGSVNEVLLDENGYEYQDSNTEYSTGFAANIGLRIGVGYKKKHNIEIRTSYMKGVTSYKPNVFGVNCLFNF